MKKILIGITILVIGIFIWWSYTTSAVNSSDKHSETFVVGKGESVRSIAKGLEEQKLIKSQFAFHLLVKTMGIENQIKAGSFKLSPSMSSATIAKALTEKTQDIWVTIPEGKRADEIADILQQNFSSYDSSWREKLNANEGYLFPDTYLFPQQISIDQIMTIMRSNFDQKYKTISIGRSDMTQQEIVTIASIVEREAVTSQDMGLVASVLENRLSAGMPLGSDVTVAYALGYNKEEKTWWKKDLTVTDLQINSPYNTRVVAGLPPTPISNPGLVALSAAANPPTSDYLYFIADKKGIVHFAKTLEEHNANIAKYGLL